MKARGFTILEILVVITVVAVLITVAVPKFKGMQEQGKKSQAQSELKTLQTALESYYIHHSNYPAKATFMADLTGTTTTPQIITAALPDPFAANGSDYYKYSVNGRYYAVWSVGLDHTSATADIDASGNVPSSGDDIVVTNGTKTALNLTTDTNNCGSIGTACTSGQTCTSGACVTPCTPNCSGKTCGNDGCGGSCGTCSTGQTCTNGNCASSLLGLGGSCTLDTNCQSGHCIWGACTNPAGQPNGTNYDGSDGNSCGGDLCLSGYCYAISGEWSNNFDCTDGSNGSGCNNHLGCSSGHCTFINAIDTQCSASGLGLNATCNENAGCASPYYCDMAHGKCTTGALGVGCGSRLGCQSQYYCDTWNWVCTAGTPGNGCRGAADCAAGYYCDSRDKVCTDGSSGSGCASGAQCQSHSCIGWQCT